MIEIILKRFLLDIRFIMAVLADPADMQTHTVFTVVPSEVLNYSWCAFSSKSILQKHLLTGFKILKDACFVIAILCIFLLHEERRIKVKCMKRVNGNKEHFISAENDEDDKDILMKIKF